MHSVDITTRIRYSETDQMGYVYYGNYAAFYEIGRVELFRSLGITYRELEEMGVMMPVYEMNCRYIRPAKYDDEIIIRTFIKEIPITRIEFTHEILNSNSEILINRGKVTLVCIDMKTNKLIKAPSVITDPLKKIFA